MEICTLAASMPGGRSAWQPVSFAHLAVSESTPETSGQPSVNCSWLPGMMPIQIPLQSMNKARKKGLSWSCLFIRIWLVGSFVRVSAASWVCFVQMIGSLRSLFQFFKWFWVLIKCNLGRVLGTPYIPPEGGIFRAGKQNACVCCNTMKIAGGSGRKFFGRRGMCHHEETSLQILILIRGQITTFRIYCIQSSLVLRGWVKVHDVLQLCQDVLSLFYTSSFHSFCFCGWCWSSFDFLIPPAFNFPEFSLCLDLES